jgi:hypothetical protein
LEWELAAVCVGALSRSPARVALVFMRRVGWWHSFSRWLVAAEMHCRGSCDVQQHIQAFSYELPLAALRIGCCEQWLPSPSSLTRTLGVFGTSETSQLQACSGLPHAVPLCVCVLFASGAAALLACAPVQLTQVFRACPRVRMAAVLTSHRHTEIQVPSRCLPHTLWLLPRVRPVCAVLVCIDTPQRA